MGNTPCKNFSLEIKKGKKFPINEAGNHKHEGRAGPDPWPRVGWPSCTVSRGLRAVRTSGLCCAGTKQPISHQPSRQLMSLPSARPDGLPGKSVVQRRWARGQEPLGTQQSP